MWALYEEKLILVKPSALPFFGDKEEGSFKDLINDHFYKSYIIRFLIITYCIVPLVFLLGYSGDYTDKEFIFMDTIFSILYVVEYIFRGMVNLTFKDGTMAIYKSTNKQEACIIVFLVFCILYNIEILSNGLIIIIRLSTRTNRMNYISACAIFRTYRLAVLFPDVLR